MATKKPQPLSDRTQPVAQTVMGKPPVKKPAGKPAPAQIKTVLGAHNGK